MDNPRPIRPTPPIGFQAKIEQYQADVTRLEAELKHVQILLRGHQIWLDEVKQKEAK